MTSIVFALWWVTMGDLVIWPFVPLCCSTLICTHWHMFWYQVCVWLSVMTMMTQVLPKRNIYHMIHTYQIASIQQPNASLRLGLSTIGFFETGGCVVSQRSPSWCIVWGVYYWQYFLLKYLLANNNFPNKASDWLATQLPVIQKPC